MACRLGEALGRKGPTLQGGDRPQNGRVCVRCTGRGSCPPRSVSGACSTLDRLITIVASQTPRGPARGQVLFAMTDTLAVQNVALGNLHPGAKQIPLPNVVC